MLIRPARGRPLNDLADYYLPSFKACVMEGKSRGIMCSCEQRSRTAPTADLLLLHPRVSLPRCLSPLRRPQPARIRRIRSACSGPKKGTLLEQESLPFLDVLLSHLRAVDNAVNGVPMCANPKYLDDVLRKSWGECGYHTLP